MAIIQEHNFHYSLNANLPDELIEIILLKLTVKQLTHLKVVARDWRSFISHPRFAEKHFESDLSPTNRLLCKSGSVNQVCAVDIDAPLRPSPDVRYDVFFQIPSPVNDQILKKFCVLGSCRGFLLIGFISEGTFPYFIVWNPSTGNTRHFQVEIQHSMCGFGYDKAMNEYLIVLLSFQTSGQATFTDVYVLSVNNSLLSAGQRYNVPSIKISESSHPGLLLHEAIHWLCDTGEQSSYFPLPVIVAFHLREKNIFFIEVPEELVQIDSKTLFLRELEGNLCLCRSSKRSPIWIMTQYRLHASWTSSFDHANFRTFGVPLDVGASFLPISFVKAGTLLGHSRSALLKMENKTVFDYRRFLDVLPTHELCYVHLGMYRETLLSLPGPAQM